MKVDGKEMRPIWFDKASETVQVIDQRLLPHELIIEDLNTVDDVIHAIKEMVVRGAPLIGATGALGVYVSLVQENNGGADSKYLEAECNRLKDARPTAMNLFWGVDRVRDAALKEIDYDARVKAALAEALEVVEEEAVNCQPPHRLGTGETWDPSHGDHGQCGRSSHAAQHGGRGDCGNGPDHTGRRRGQQDRHLLKGACRQGQQHSFLCGPAFLHL